MPRIMIHCPFGEGDVPTGYRTTDVDLTIVTHTRSFRCSCGRIHDWNGDIAWAETHASANSTDHLAIPSAIAPA